MGIISGTILETISGTILAYKSCVLKWGQSQEQFCDGCGDNFKANFKGQLEDNLGTILGTILMTISGTIFPTIHLFFLILSGIRTECPSGTKCVAEFFCNENAIMVAYRVNLTPAQKKQRGSLTVSFSNIDINELQRVSNHFFKSHTLPQGVLENCFI